MRKKLPKKQMMNKISQAFLWFTHRLDLLLGILICVTPAVYFLSQGIFDSYLALDSPNWPSTSSQSFFVIEYEDHREVNYSYRIDNVLRDSKRISFSYPFPEDAQWLKHLEDGQTVAVFYSPRFPAQATLQTGWRWGPLIFIIIGIVMAGLGWLAFALISKHRSAASIDPVNWT